MWVVGGFQFYWDRTRGSAASVIAVRKRQPNGCWNAEIKAAGDHKTETNPMSPQILWQAKGQEGIVADNLKKHCCKV